MKYIKTYEIKTDLQKNKMLREFCEFLVTFASENNIHLSFYSIFSNHYNFSAKYTSYVQHGFRVFDIDKYSDESFLIKIYNPLPKVQSNTEQNAINFVEFLNFSLTKFSISETILLFRFEDIEKIKQDIVENYGAYSDSKKYNL